MNTTAKQQARMLAQGEPQLDDDGKVIVDMATCGSCGRSWNDALMTSWTPAPSGRCPFEYWHRGAQ